MQGIDKLKYLNILNKLGNFFKIDKVSYFFINYLIILIYNN